MKVLLSNWIGKYIVAVGVIHSSLGLVAFGSTFEQLIQAGFFNTINGEPELEFPFWFVVTGIFWIVLGLLINYIENESIPLPPFLGWVLMSLTIIGVAMMPLSGWWLFFVPSIALIRRHFHKEQGSSLGTG